MCPHLNIRRYLKRISLAAVPGFLSVSVSWGGVMDCNDYTVNDYKNFAENKGAFDAGATNIPIYDKNGNQTGTIDRVMNFDSAIDVWRGGNGIRSGEGCLVGGPSFIMGAGHDYNQSNVSFSQRFGGKEGTAYYDNYRVVSAVNGDSTLYPGSSTSDRDFRVSRLSKIVTEAQATDFYMGSASDLIGEILQRVGGGTQVSVNESETKLEDLEYVWLSGGFVKVSASGTRDLEAREGDGPAWAFDSMIVRTESINNGDQPMTNQVAGGDSGSGTWWYDKDAEKWYFVGALTSGSISYNGNTTGVIIGANKWAVSVIEGYNYKNVATDSDSTISWKQGENPGGGELVESTLTVGGKGINYSVLVEGCSGDTAGDGFRASDESLNACKNLILSGSGNNVLEVDGGIDTGAGYIQFKTDFIVRAANAGTRLNTAGWVVDKGVLVKNELTGASGDEWRMIGDGIVRIEGAGNNMADMNIGGNLLVELDRAGGNAARNVRINAGNAIVRLVGAGEQIGGNIIFGHRGGILDIYGNNFSYDNVFVGLERTEGIEGNYIAAMDSGARIANLKANSQSTFTYISGGVSKFVGTFMDDSARGAILNVEYSGGVSGVWTLSGGHQTGGAWKIKSGNLIVSGDLKDYYGNEGDFNTATLKAGAVVVDAGAKLTAGSHSKIEASISSAGTVRVERDSVISGNITLAISGQIDADVSEGSSVLHGVISGQGGISKSGNGVLELANAGNSFSGINTIYEGVVKADSSGALGQGAWDIQEGGTIFVDASHWAAYKGRINSSSLGTIGLSGNVNDVSSVSMNGLSSMALGAVGSASLGEAGTSQVLAGWTADQGYHFGGSAGELTVNARLTGSGSILIGGNNKDSVVILAGDNSGYKGEITLHSGSGIIMRGTNLMEQISSLSSGTLLVRGNVSDDYDFSGRSNLRFGSDSLAEYSGRLSGANYRFGGTGTLRLTSRVSGNVVIESGTHIWLNASNDVSGTLEVKNNATLQIGDGLQGGSIGSGNVNLNFGGKLVFNSDADISIGTQILGLGTVGKAGTGTAVLTNNCSTSKINVMEGALQIGDGGKTGSLSPSTQIDLYDGSSLIFNRSDDVVMNGYIRGVSGSAKVVKMGAGKLTLGNWQSNYTGGTFVKEGTLAFSNLDAAGSREITLEGGTIDMGGLALTNTVNVVDAASSFVNSSKFAGVLGVKTDMTLNGGLGSGDAGIMIDSGSVLTLANSLEWYHDNTLNFSKLTNDGVLNFDFTGTGITLNSEQSWKLMDVSDGSFGQYQWDKKSVVLGNGYMAGLSSVNGVLSFVVSRNPCLDEHGNVIQDYMPGVGEITEVNNVNQYVMMTIQNGVNAAVKGNVEGYLDVQAGGSAKLGDSLVSGEVWINGGQVLSDSNDTVVIGATGSLVFQDPNGEYLMKIKSSGSSVSGVVSDGLKAFVDNESNVELAGDFEKSRLEFQKSDTILAVKSGDKLTVRGDSSVVNGMGVKNTSIQVSGVMNNYSKTAIGIDILVKSGGILGGSGIYSNKISIEDGGMFKVGNSPGVSSVKDLSFIGSQGSGILDFAINGTQIASTGGWSDEGHSQLSVSGVFSLAASLDFNLEIGRDYFNSLSGVTSEEYVLILFSNSSVLNLGGMTYQLFDVENIQAWFEQNTSWSFNSADPEALVDGASGVRLDHLTYSYNQDLGTGSLSATLNYGGTAVPEPCTVAMLLAGFAGGLLLRRRRGQ